MSKDDSVIRLKVNDSVEEIDLTDFDGLESRDFRIATGVAMENAGELSFLEYVAGFLWLKRRREDKSLTYDDVLKSLNLGNTSDAQDGDEADPPA